MKNIKMSKNALPKELADNYISELLNSIVLDTTDDTIDDSSKLSEYKKIKEMLNTLIHESEKLYQDRAKKELYDFIFCLKMAKNSNL